MSVDPREMTEQTQIKAQSGRPCEVGGVSYRSISEAARALGTTHRLVISHIESGEPLDAKEAVDNRKRNAEIMRRIGQDKSYGWIGQKMGLTRSVVAGVVYRNRRASE